MASYRELTDLQWHRLSQLIPAGSWTGRPRADHRQTLNGMLFVIRTGCRWRDMPERYGSHITVWRRFQEWNNDGVFHRLWRTFLGQLDEIGRLEWQHCSPERLMQRGRTSQAA